MSAKLLWGLLAAAVAIAAVPAALALNEQRDARRDRRELQPRGRLLDVGGRRMHLIAEGEGPAVVVITGGGEPAGMLAPLQERIARFARASTYDRPGFGWSDRAPAPLSFDDHARDLHALLTAAAEPGPYLLVAESLGGLIARAFARLFPDAVAGIVLVDAAEEAHVFAHLPILRSAARQQMLQVRLARPLGLVRRMVNRAAGQRYPDDLRRELAAQLGSDAHWRAAASEVQAYELTPPAGRVAGGFGVIAQPLTVIAHDRPFTGALQAVESGWREAQERLAALSPSSRFVVAEGAGHAIAQEQPDLVAAEVRALLAAIDEPPASLA